MEYGALLCLHFQKELKCEDVAKYGLKPTFVLKEGF